MTREAPNQGTDPANPPEEETKLKHGTTSDDLRASIAKRRQEAVMKEIGDPEEKIEEPPEDVVEEGYEREEEPPTEEPEEEEEEELVTVKVYDEEYQVPKKEVDEAGGVKAYQMQKAAERKLDEAKRAAEETRQLQEENRRLNEELKQRAEQKGQPAPEIGEDGLTEAQRKHIEELSEDYSEEFVATKRDLYLLQNQRPDQGAVDPDQIADRAVKKVREEARQNEVKAANDYFSEHYSHLEKDPHLNAIAERYAADLMREKPHLPLVEVAKQSGALTEKWVKKVSGKDPFAAKRERKRQTSTPPAAVSKRSEREPEPEPKTASEKVREMRAARGQPV